MRPLRIRRISALAALLAALLLFVTGCGAFSCTRVTADLPDAAADVYANTLIITHPAGGDVVAGTGFVVCTEGNTAYAITNYHVVEDAPNGEVTVRTAFSNLPMTDPRTLACIELFGNAGLPVLFHVGVSHYYTFGQPYKETPEYGGLDDFITVAHMFPDYDLIAAHCVNNYVRELAEKTAGLNRIYTDTTFCSAAKIADAVEVMGDDKILLGTDYPFTTIADAYAQVEIALRDKPESLYKVAYGNAARLLRIED